MKVLITGIDGFLGAALAGHLEHEVFGNDNGICSTGLTKLAYYDTDCALFVGMDAICRLRRPDVLVHCAATAHEGLSNFSPSFVTRNIFEASVATFSAAIARGVRRIVFMSSMARYGGQGVPFSEKLAPDPIDPYGIAKRASEDVLRALCETHGVKWCVLVPHNIIGAGQKYDDPYRNVAAIMINRALQGMPIQVYGDGSQVRCFSPVQDILPCIARAIDGAADGEVVNIGPDSGEIPINALASMVASFVGVGVPIEHIPPRPNEVHQAYCTADKARELLGYEATVPLEECIGEMVAFIRARGPKPFKKFADIEIPSARMPEGWRK